MKQEPETVAVMLSAPIETRARYSRQGKAVHRLRLLVDDDKRIKEFHPKVLVSAATCQQPIRCILHPVPTQS